MCQTGAAGRGHAFMTSDKCECRSKRERAHGRHKTKQGAVSMHHAPQIKLGISATGKSFVQTDQLAVHWQLREGCPCSCRSFEDGVVSSCLMK